MENENRKNIVWLSEITKQDVEIAGGKGANLAELYNAKLPVPEAFIVTANAYLNFIEEAGLKEKINEILRSIDVENTVELEEKAKEIQELIVNAENFVVKVKLIIKTLNNDYIDEIREIFEILVG